TTFDSSEFSAAVGGPAGASPGRTGNWNEALVARTAPTGSQGEVLASRGRPGLEGERSAKPIDGVARLDVGTTRAGANETDQRTSRRMGRDRDEGTREGALPGVAPSSKLVAD